MTADLPTHPSTEAERRVEDWNATVPVGTPCHWWKLMDRSGKRWTSVTRSNAWVLCGEPVVLVEGLTGGLHLDCVQPLPLGSEEAFLATAAPSTEAVGEVRRCTCAPYMVALDGHTHLCPMTLDDEFRELGWLDPAAAEELRAEVQRLRARIHEAVDECQRRYGPVESQLAKCRGLMREALRRHDETSGHPPGTHISGYGQAAAAAILEERDQARADLSAMTSDRDWLRGELDKAIAEAAAMRPVVKEAQRLVSAQRLLSAIERDGGDPDERDDARLDVEGHDYALTDAVDAYNAKED